MGSVFGPIRFLLPVCRLCWFLYTLNIHCIFSFFVAIFSATIDDRNLIFGHKLEAFLDPSDSYFLFADLVGFYTHWTYMHISRHIFLSNYWWQRSDIWSQASYRYPISWEAFLDPSDSYFLFADFVDFYTHWTYILYMPIFSRIFLSNNWWQKSDIWSQASYRYPISWEAFLNPSDSYFLFPDFVDFYTHWTYMLIFRRIFLSNYWWQKSDIWSQASYRYAMWEVFLDPSDSYFLFADLVGFYTHWT